MVERRDIASWLQGAAATAGSELGFPGQRLGRPEQGRGSMGRPGRRAVALALDWGLCLLIARAFLGSGQAALLVFALEQVLLVGSAGASLGHRLVGLHVETVSGAHPGPARAVLRAVLLSLAVPALVWDRDQRGLHDKAAGTLIARR